MHRDEKGGAAALICACLLMDCIVAETLVDAADVKRNFAARK